MANADEPQLAIPGDPVLADASAADPDLPGPFTVGQWSAGFQATSCASARASC